MRIIQSFSHPALLAFMAGLTLLAAGCASDTAPTTATVTTEDTATTQDTATTADTAFNDTDVRFTQNMLPHHMQALRVAQVEVERGEDPEMVALARQIIAAQEAEIAEMQEFLDVFGAEEVPAPEDQQQVWDRNYQAIQDAEASMVDVVFMTNMIPHHAAAVPMSQSEITLGSYPQAIELAEQIKTAQREEISQMVANLRARN